MDMAVAGIPVRLVFHEAGLLRQFEQHVAPCVREGDRGESVGRLAPTGPSSIVIEVSRAERCREPLSRAGDNAWYFDGNGEYEAVLDPNGGVSHVRLTGPHPVDALLNFIRAAYTRLVHVNDGLVIHAACVVRDGAAYLFHGRSGAGKSTVCALSTDCTILSDDLTAVRKLGGRFLAWGLPSATCAVNSPGGVRDEQGAFEVTGIFKLVQDTDVWLVPVSAAPATADMIALPRLALEPDRVGCILELLGELTGGVDCYELHFRKDDSFWDCIDRRHSKRGVAKVISHQ